MKKPPTPPPQDQEDQNEPPETPGETPDAEDIAEGPDADQQSGPGIVDSATPPGQNPAGADQGGDDSQGGDTPNVTPEEQKIYDAVFSAALQAIYGKNQISIIITKLANGKDNLSFEVGHSAAMIMTSLMRTAQQQGKSIPDDVLYAVGQDVIGELCNIAVGSHIMTEAQVPQIANAALFEGMRLWGLQMQQTGGMTPDKVDQAKQDLQDQGLQQQAPTSGPPQQGAPQAGAPAPGQPNAQSPSPPAGAPPGIVNAAQQPPGA